MLHIYVANQVHLQRHGGDFQIVRNEDWGQATGK